MAKVIYDIIRKEYVADQPEERIRQGIIRLMIGDLGYPKELIGVEKALVSLPHLSGVGSPLPDRRVDIICWRGGTLEPLVVIECKAVKITPQVLRQVEGYNYYLQSPFIAVANNDEIRTGWLGPGGYEYVDFLPSYKELVTQ
ncbi:MAG: type I restriction enzyme HsdR N-terminal domain-containing protein [Chlamydiota bacterium]